jgi:hypothetical protein
MAETIDALTIQYEENGEVKVKQLDKRILTRGSWTTIIFKFQESDREGGFSEPRAVIARYQKRGGVYRQQSKFKISSARQARQVIDTLDEWFPADAVADEVGEPADEG